jgi:hypothetical protein
MLTWGLDLGASSFERCPVSNCLLTNNRSSLPLLSDFDAVLFHLRNMDGGGRRVAVPNQKRRKNGQRYVMFLMESPQHDGFKYDKFKGEQLKTSETRFVKSWLKYCIYLTKCFKNKTRTE